MDTYTHCVVYVTCPDAKSAEKIAAALVKEKLAACANIVPDIRSVYEWQGKIENDPEQMLIIKTRFALMEKLTRRVKDMHDYDVPEIIAMPIMSGSSDYLDWIDQVTSGDAQH